MSVTDYDTRQLNRLLQRIEDYDRNDIFLGTLLGDAKRLIACLESVPPATGGELQNAWGQLQEWYAVAIDQSPSNDHPARLDPAYADLLEKLRNLVKGVLNS